MEPCPANSVLMAYPARLFEDGSAAVTSPWPLGRSPSAAEQGEKEHSAPRSCAAYSRPEDCSSGAPETSIPSTVIPSAAASARIALMRSRAVWASLAA